MKHDVRIYDAEQQSMFLSEWLDESRATTPAALALAGSSSRERNILCFGLRYVHMLIHTEPPEKACTWLREISAWPCVAPATQNMQTFFLSHVIKEPRGVHTKQSRRHQIWRD